MKIIIVAILLAYSQISFSEINHKYIKHINNIESENSIDISAQNFFPDIGNLFYEKMLIKEKAEEDDLNKKIQAAVNSAEKSTSDDISELRNLINWGLAFIGLAVSSLGIASAIVVVKGFMAHQNLNREADFIIEEAKKKIDVEIEKITNKANQFEEIAKKHSDEFIEHTKEVDNRFSNIENDFRKRADGLEKSWVDIDKDFDNLPEPMLEPKAGNEYRELSPSEYVIWKDYDSIIVMCDRLKLTSNERKISDHLTKIAAFWRITKNFDCAYLRNIRAIQLNGKSAHSYEGLVTTLIYWISYDKGKIPTKNRIIEALGFINTALQQGHDTALLLHHRGWLYDEMDDLENSIIEYKKARLKSYKEQSGYRSFIGYNLACVLAKNYQFDESIKMLQEAFEKEPQWALDAKEDVNLEPLRKSEKHMKSYENLISDAKDRIASSNLKF